MLKSPKIISSLLLFIFFLNYLSFYLGTLKLPKISPEDVSSYSCYFRPRIWTTAYNWFTFICIIIRGIPTGIPRGVPCFHNIIDFNSFLFNINIRFSSYYLTEGSLNFIFSSFCINSSTEITIYFFAIKRSVDSFNKLWLFVCFRNNIKFSRSFARFSKWYASWLTVVSYAINSFSHWEHVRLPH